MTNSSITFVSLAPLVADRQLIIVVFCLFFCLGALGAVCLFTLPQRPFENTTTACTGFLVLKSTNADHISPHCFFVVVFINSI